MAETSTLTQPPKPELANPYEDFKTASSRIDYVLERDKDSRQSFARNWFMSIAFRAGWQWIVYDGSTRRFRAKNLPVWFPRTVTNKFGEKVADLVSAYLQGRPPIRYLPATDNDEDIATAEVGERVREVIYEEAGIDDLEEEIASWVVTTGNVFLYTYYDYDPEHGTHLVQRLRCPLCARVASPAEAESTPGCPACAETETPVPFDQMTPAIDEAGAPIGDSLPIGKLRTEIVTPFEIRLDPGIRRWEDHRRIVRLYLYTVEEAKRKWPEFADKIKPERDDSIDSYYLEELAFLSAVPGVSRERRSGSDNTQRVMAYEIFELPSEEYPEGLHAIRLGRSNETVVKVEPLTTEVGAGIRKGQKFISFAFFGGEIVNGRFWRRSRMEDLITLQVFRNVIEASMQLTVQRTGNSMWLNPKGSQVNKLTGEPGQIVDYNPISFAGTSFAKPERVPADLNAIQPFIILLNKIDDAFERLAGTQFVQGADVPPGVTAASALSFLAERAERSLSPLRREWAKSWKRWEQQAIEIWRQHAQDERIRVVAGNNRKWDVEKFSSADLRGSVNMIIDYNSLFPKSQTTRRANIEQLIRLGVINSQDPEQQWKILKEYGETELKGSADLDWRDAVKESDAFLRESTPPLLRPLIDNDMVHIMQHTEFAKSDEFRELPEEGQNVWVEHIKAHWMGIQAKQMALAPPMPEQEGKGAAPSGGGGEAAPGEPASIRKGKERAKMEGEPAEAPPLEGLPLTG